MRKNRTNKKTVLIITTVLGGAGFALRLIWRSGTASSAAFIWLLALLSALAAAYAGYIARGVKPRPGFRANHQSATALIFQPVAVLLLVIGSLIGIFSATGANDILIGIVGLLGVLCLAVCAVQIFFGVKPSALLYMGTALRLFVKTIPQFRAWSADPIIADYCFRLFAAIAALCLAFHLSGFALEIGRRGLTLFWSILGLFFSMVCLADGGSTNVMMHLGWALFFGVELWELLALPRKRRKPLFPRKDEPPVEDAPVLDEPPVKEAPILSDGE